MRLNLLPHGCSICYGNVWKGRGKSHWSSRCKTHSCAPQPRSAAKAAELSGSRSRNAQIAARCCAGNSPADTRSFRSFGSESGGEVSPTVRATPWRGAEADADSPPRLGEADARRGGDADVPLPALVLRLRPRPGEIEDGCRGFKLVSLPPETQAIAVLLHALKSSRNGPGA